MRSSPNIRIPIPSACNVRYWVSSVRRQGYYHYRRHTENRPVDPVHGDMLEWVKQIAQASDDTYGSRRMNKAMNCLGYPISRNKARKLMKEANVQIRHRKKHKVSNNSNHKQPVFDNLVQ